MFLDENIISTLAIAFFIFCIVLILHFFFFVPNSDVKKRIYSFTLIYGIFISVMETLKYRNTPNLEISLSRALGGILGCITGFYFGYQFCILIKIIDDTSFIESKESSDTDDTSLTESSNIEAIINAVCFCFGEVGRQLGSFLGSILFSI